MNQHRISEANVRDAHQVLLSFAQEFELFYCQRLPTCIHFVCPCMHLLMHLPHEVLQISPPICSSQWMLERTISNLGKEIKQHSNLFANLSQQGIRHARTNALMAIIPDLEGNGSSGGGLPCGSKDLQNGYILLHAQDKHPKSLHECEAEALRRFLPTLPETDGFSVRRWARLRIPTGQICYTMWKELRKSLEKRRTARMVKVGLRLL